MSSERPARLRRQPKRWASDEGPQHRVTIDYDLAVGRHEVTFAEWDACVADRSCGGHHPDDRGWGRGRRPVINVSWEDAQAYVAWVQRKTGQDYRLLSEAEWEYVARAGTTGPFHTGARIRPDQANFRGRQIYPATDGSYRWLYATLTVLGNLDNFVRGCGIAFHRQWTVDVRCFSANAFGLDNGHGNVWEWVEDCWHNSYEGAPTDGTARTT